MAAIFGAAAKKAIDEGALQLVAPLQISRIHKTDVGLQVDVLLDGVASTIEVDRIVAATGFRPGPEHFHPGLTRLGFYPRFVGAHNYVGQLIVNRCDVL